MTSRGIVRIAIAALAVLAAAPASAQAGTITVQVSGSGSVRDDQGRIDCPAVACSASYNAGTVTFTATPGGDATFQGWSGACSQFTGTTCSVNGGFDAEIGAAFTTASSPPPPPPPPPPPAEPRRFPVSVVPTGPGAGRIVSEPAGIDCARTERGAPTGACTASFTEGDAITLHRVDGVFQSWGGACSGDQHSCRLVVRGPLEASAFFWARPGTPGSVLVTVLGGGMIQQRTTYLGCTASCIFFGGHDEVLTFEPVSQFVPRVPGDVELVPEDVIFDRWRGVGSCSSQGDRHARCTVRINGIEAHDVVAEFRRKGSLRFRVRGRGIVRTTRRPSTATDRIECATDCSVLLRDEDGVHTWEADPEAGWRFSHWSGFCARILEDETCSAREERGTRTSTAVFVRDPGRGEARLAIHSSTEGGARIVDVLDGERRLCPGACRVEARRRRGGSFMARFAPRIPANAEFKRWENCPRVLRGRGGLDLCELRSRDRVDGVIRAVVERDPAASFRIAGMGGLRVLTTRLDCTPVCRVHVPPSLQYPRQVTPVAAPGWYFSHWTGYCSGWGRTSGSTCLLRALWHDEQSTAVFRPLGALRATVRGGGTLRAVHPGSGFASTERFTCREDASPCVQANGRAPLYRRYQAYPDDGWRFSHWEGYCNRIFFNDQCDVPGDDVTRDTVAVFVRR